MSEIVVKFGGSNLRTREDILKIVHIINNYKCKLTIVVSAFYGITNQLRDACYKAVENHKSIPEFLDQLHIQNAETVINLIQNKAYSKAANADIQRFIDELNRKLRGINYLHQIPDSVYDQILSYGERLSATILHYVLLDNDIENHLYFPEEIGLRTNGRFKDADINLNASAHSVRKHLKNDRISIVPGFYGISEKNEITLLGRGGTDYTAAALAWCLDAEALDIWKDVNGFCSADPKDVDNTINNEALSYTEAAELAYFGAKILHPSTIGPVQDKSIPVHIYDIREGNRSKPVSVVSNEISKSQNGVKSISSSNEFAIIKLKGAGIGLKPGILAKVTNGLNENNINISSVITSQIAINILLSKVDLLKAKHIIDKLDINVIQEIELLTEISLIAVVGPGITKQAGIAGQIFTATAKAGINVKMCALGASVVSVYLIIDKQDTSLALKAIHHELFHQSNNNQILIHTNQED
ncbi:MAG: aspartate kinase [Bacteroidales bacterium]|nr:aspartate kinase [Bacteroidales bacterium]